MTFFERGLSSIHLHYCNQSTKFLSDFGYICSETLVHSTLEPCDDADFSFPVFFNMKEHIVHVKKRPHLRTFLERVAQIFEIVIFTASQSIYAKQLLDILDPDGKLISRRAYRESCVFTDGSYTKDLTVLGVDLAKIVIIDNSPQVITCSLVLFFCSRVLFYFIFLADISWKAFILFSC